MSMQYQLLVYKTDMFCPHYEPFEGERWKLALADMVLCRGYWSPARLVVGMAALMRREAEGFRSWMSMTPMEIESQELGVRHAGGHVVVMGLGMGWAAANAALRPEVTRVTVVEFDPEVIDAVAACRVFEQLPPEAAAKLTVLRDDAYSFIPDAPADTLMADIWLPLFGAERDADVRRMHANTGGTRVYFWGQELTIAHRARVAGLPLTAETVAMIVADMGLPLIGPGECADYTELVGKAAEGRLATAE